MTLPLFSTPRLSGLRAFKTQAKFGKLPHPVLLRKDLTFTASPMSDRKFRFTISTASIDRDQDTISVSGWDLTGFVRNPVVLWGHGVDPTVGTWPIGRAFDVRPDGGVLRASVEFDPADMPMTGAAAEACVRKLVNGSLAAVSVGFRPIDYAVTSDLARGADGYMPGIDFKRQELLEFSIVSVPANAEALLIQPENLDDVPAGNPPKQAHVTVRRAGTPLPQAPLASFIEPRFLSSHEKAHEIAELTRWIDQTRKRADLKTCRKSELEVLTARVLYLQRGFR